MAKSRMGSLADQLRSIKQYVSRPETAEAGTNWSIIPSAGNPRLPNTDIEPEFEIIPSIPAIEEAMNKVDLIERLHSSVLPGSGRLVKRHLESHVVGGDFERDQEGRLIRIGKIRFANGDDDPQVADFEQVMIRGEGDVATAQNIPARVGTILGQRERARADDPVPAKASNAKSAKHVKAAVPKHRKLTKARRPMGELSRDEARSLLRSMGVDGTVKYEDARRAAGLTTRKEEGRAALPSAASSVGPIFLAMDVKSASSSGLEMWADLHVGIREAEAWRRVGYGIGEKTKTTLDALSSAGTLSDLGMAHGYKGRHAKIAGRRALLAANDNLEAIIKKYVA